MQIEIPMLIVRYNYMYVPTSVVWCGVNTDRILPMYRAHPHAYSSGRESEIYNLIYPCNEL